MKKIILFGAMSASALFVQSSVAAEDGGYMGGGLGVGAAAIQNMTTGVSTIYTSSGVRLLGGYQVNKNFAIEGEYVNLGTFTDPTLAVDATTYGVSGLGLLPLGSGQTVSLYGKVGMSSTTTKAKATGVLSVPADQTKTGVSFGAGVNIDFTPKATLRISLDSYQYGVGSDWISGRMTFWGVNGIFRF